MIKKGASQCEPLKSRAHDFSRGSGRASRPVISHFHPYEKREIHISSRCECVAARELEFVPSESGNPMLFVL